MTDYSTHTEDAGAPTTYSGSLANDVPDSLKIESRDYGAHPASIGEKIAGTAKVMAQPAAAVVNKAYKYFNGQ